MSWKVTHRNQKLAIRSSSVSFKAMLLAAGRGERMRPLTDTVPKPLLKVGNKMLIEVHLEKLAQAGFREVIINHAYLGEIIEQSLGNGENYGIQIRYSPETVALETAGGIANALPLLAEQPFLVVNADIYCEMDFALLLPVMQQMQVKPENNLAHLVMVNNPPHHPEGDFVLNGNQIFSVGENKLTFSGIGIYQPELFADVLPNKAARLAPLLRQAMKQKKVSGEHYRGTWVDIGTPERLHLLNRQLAGGLQN